MAVEISTKLPTETDLETRISLAMRAAFPWIEPGSLRHQLKFTFKFGRQVIKIDGTKTTSAQARADILILHDERPLAILELKRPGLELTLDDQDQGLSYARMLHPRPPIVVVTNGADLILLDSFSGEIWSPETRSEAALAKVMANAGVLAMEDLKKAVDTLMGPGSNVWMSAVRAATEATLADMTGEWQEPLKPFVADFLIPRKATSSAIASIAGAHKITIVEGPPLAGKSSVLREIAVRQASADDMAILFICPASAPLAQNWV